MNGVCRRFQRHISGMMPIGIVADLEIVHIQQCDPRRADGLTNNFLIIAAVVGAGQRVLIEFFLITFCVFLNFFLGFGLHFFHAGALDLPLQAADQQNVRKDAQTDHDEFLKVQRRIEKKAVVGRKEKRRIHKCNEAAYNACCIAVFHEHGRKGN